MKKQYEKLVDEFVEELKTAKYWLKPDGNPKKEWKLFEASTLKQAQNKAGNAARNAMRNATRNGWDTARNAARDAARNAAWDAAWDAMRNATWKTARMNAKDTAKTNAAWNAAWNATRDTTRNATGAAWDAAWDAARDTTLFARMLICLDLPMPLKHLQHVNARMEVWRKGYCLLCDVNGVLYVYAKKMIENE